MHSTNGSDVMIWGYDSVPRITLVACRPANFISLALITALALDVLLFIGPHTLETTRIAPHQCLHRSKTGLETSLYHTSQIRIHSPKPYTTFYVFPASAPFLSLVFILKIPLPSFAGSTASPSSA